ncbi:hypothetical protein FKZ61_018050 [Litorilinea aerophila]|uniref:Uncharacterized protein n=1 Tax=Litorilinea aerophila TaxID=1204385 RepID=A0A540VBH2_9CHLR|nr:hypothetical protein [Litorilinea aerophila]MCC9078004.1 hypothetical protein [Litorilinea aerophila]
MQDTAGIYEFVGIGEMAETLTHMLSLNLKQGMQSGGRQRADLGRVEQLVLQQARDYLSKVREGFMLSVRATQVTHPRELRYLLERVLTDWSQLSQELGLDTGAAGEESASSQAGAGLGMPTADHVLHVERVRYQLLAFGMAAVAMGYLPRLPAQQITFPHSYSDPPTYADIPVPSTPGEMLWRIEELEQMLWRLMSADMQELVQRQYGPLRRTYGFFEASAWLSQQEAERFGIKPQRRHVALL